MERKEVFISYKSEDQDQALWLKSVLETDGISCWIYLVLHRAQRQYWRKLVCLPAVNCLPFP